MHKWLIFIQITIFAKISILIPRINKLFLWTSFWDSLLWYFYFKLISSENYGIVSFMTFKNSIPGLRREIFRMNHLIRNFYQYSSTAFAACSSMYMRDILRQMESCGLQTINVPTPVK